MHIKKLLIYILFAATLMIGLFIVKDYGFAIDEHINRDNGIVSLNYILQLLQRYLSINIWALDPELRANAQDLHSYKDRDYGVAFDLLAIIIERALNLNTSREYFLLRHYLTYFIFWVATIYFYKLIKKNFNNNYIAVLAVSMLYLSPRIFADAFYNNKDLIFLSVFLIATYYLIENYRTSSKYNILLFGIFSGVSIDLRIVAVILPALFFILMAARTYTAVISKREALNQFFLYTISCSVITLLFWPWLWSDPITNFLAAFQNMAKFRWLNWVLYRGHYYPSSSLPWHYLPTWILITTPPLYIAFIFIGQLKCLHLTLTSKLKENLQVNNITIIIMMVISGAPLFAVIILNSTIYDGWRQFYFIYPSLLFFAIIGIKYIYSFVKKISYVKKFLVLIFFLSLTKTFAWMVYAHPYQNIYFNLFAGSEWDKRYDIDYWGLTNLRGIEFILSDTASNNIKIYSLGLTATPQSFNLLSTSQKKRVEVTTDIESANYVLTNFRLLNSITDIELLKRIEAEYSESFSIIVSGKPVLKIFRLPNP